MDDNRSSLEYGSSPSISAELLTGGKRLRVTSLGPGCVAVREASVIAEGPGVIRLVVGGRETLLQIELTEGIDPARYDQPFKLVKTTEQAVA